MKLYTEEQVKNFLKERTFMTEDAIDKLCAPLIPIELPSDEEIEQEAQKRHPYEKHMGATWENGLHEGFIMGAEWMKEHILNQNK